MQPSGNNMQYTNDKLYFKNTSLNKYVGGLKQPQNLKKEGTYINSQLNILNDQNQKLYPAMRYGQQYDTYNSQNTLSKNNLLSYQQDLQQQLSSQQSCCNKQNTAVPIPTSTQNNYTSPALSPTQDVYLSGIKEQYDPYTGYLYEKGLIPEDEQRRRFIYNYIDVNSAYRQINSIINVDAEYSLTPNPLTFTNGSNIMHIATDPSIFNVNDPITLTNVVSRYSVLRTIRGTQNNLPLYTFELKQGFNFMKIWYDHHIPLSYTGDTIQISIAGIIGDNSPRPTLLGNVPVSTINTIQQVYLTITQSDINTTSQITSITNTDPDYFTPSPYYFFIILPIALQPTATYTITDYNFNITYLSLEAIALNLINTSSEINPNELTSFHIITSIDSTGINITLPYNALTDTDANNNDTTTINAGGNYVIIGHVSGITPGYPDPNSYTITLTEIYHNVISIKLVSSEIPNSNKTIRSYPPESVNNILYWNDIDDGDYLYQINVPAGNYTPDELIAAMSAAFASTPRINPSPFYTSTHYIQTTINVNTSEVVFTPYKEFVLNGPIINISPPIPADPNTPVDLSAVYTITIYQPNHGTSPGETILIQNAIDDSGIPASIINGMQTVVTVIDLNTYTVTLPRFNVSANRAVTMGGVNVFIYVPDIVRFRFDQPNTMGTVLGFRNPGDPLSITPYSTSISNAAPYALELTVNSLGQTINITNNSLQMAGDNYMIMTADPIQVFESNSVIKNAFAKIILCDSPGKVLYNSYVNMTQLYENPISSLNQLVIAFYTPDGALVDFDGLEHSFTLEIITVEDIPKDTRINANTGKNYNPSI